MTAEQAAELGRTVATVNRQSETQSGKNGSIALNWGGEVGCRMNALVSKPAMDVQRFRDEHGDVCTWSEVDWEVHQNLLEIALAHRPIGGLWEKTSRRTAALAVFAYALALYAVTELTSSTRGPQPPRLQYQLAFLVSGPGRRADDRLRYSGDLRFRQQIIQVGIRFLSEVDRLSARLHRG